MKPYYYVFKPVGHPPSRKHDTLEDAIKESQRLCEIHPNQTFEVLQCVAITSAPKPQVSTFYMDGVVPKSDERYIGFPDEMTLPEIPDGYRQAIYRGMGWNSVTKVAFGLNSPSSINKWFGREGIPAGIDDTHYCEFIK
jgi:hypothetical protein